MIYRLIRNFLFLLPAETAHNIGLFGVRALGFFYRRGLWMRPRWADQLQNETPSPFGKLSSCLGLGAGLDKNAQCLWGWQALGFAFAEVGTITPLSQPGNPKPRLFRYFSYNAIVNRMGFNNHGAEVISARIRKAKKQGLRIKIGGNIGKNKNTPIELAHLDYSKAAAKIVDCVDYIVVNVSSPNTEGLRGLQSSRLLDAILTQVRNVAPHHPLFVKVAPDDFESFMDGLLSVVKKHSCDGVICGNTLANHAAAEHMTPLNIAKLPSGGLSGKPIYEKNLALLSSYSENAKNLYMIGVGGIFDGQTAQSYLESGAKLVQIYTGFIFKGPSLIKEILTTTQK